MTTLSRREFLAASAALPFAAHTSTRGQEAAKFKLGLVTYNVPKDWDLPTILKVCKEVGIAAVECRTTHKHGVEPSLTQSSGTTSRSSSRTRAWCSGAAAASASSTPPTRPS